MVISVCEVLDCNTSRRNNNNKSVIIILCSVINWLHDYSCPYYDTVKYTHRAPASLAIFIYNDNALRSR